MMILVKRCWAYSKKQVALIVLLALIFLTLIILVSGRNTDIAEQYLITDAVSPNILFAVTGLFSNFIVSIFQYKGDYFSLVRIGKSKMFNSFIAWMIISIIGLSFLVIVYYQISLWIWWKQINFYILAFIWSWMTSIVAILLIEIMVLLICLIFTKINLLYMESFVFVSLSIAASTAKGMELFEYLLGIKWLINEQGSLIFSWLLTTIGMIILLIIFEKFIYMRVKK